MKKIQFQLILLFCLPAVLFPRNLHGRSKEGLLLWSGTIVPALLPFLVLTGLMNKYQTLHLLSWLFIRFTGNSRR